MRRHAWRSPSSCAQRALCSCLTVRHTHKHTYTHTRARAPPTHTSPLLPQNPPLLTSYTFNSLHRLQWYPCFRVCVCMCVCLCVCVCQCVCVCVCHTEPTNHLDIPSKEMLEEAIQQFQGAVIAVSHDRYFLRKIATRILQVRILRHTVQAREHVCLDSSCPARTFL